MSDERDLHRVDASARCELSNAFAQLREFLRQKNPTAWLKQGKNSVFFSDLTSKILPSSSVRSASSPANLNQVSKLRHSDRQKSASPSPFNHPGISSDEETTQKTSDLLTSRDDHLTSQFADLIRWMGRCFPNYPLRDPYALAIRKSKNKIPPLVLIIASPIDRSPSSSRDFCAKVAGALAARKIATAMIDQDQGAKLHELDTSALQLVICAKAARLALQSESKNHLASISHLEVDWELCADDAVRKAELWNKIKIHLQKST